MGIFAIKTKTHNFCYNSEKLAPPLNVDGVMGFHELNTEQFFIRHISNSQMIGDDGAFVDGYVYSQDAFFEGVHFERSWMSYEQIGYKAMMVNISDAVAMNANPLYALITVALPATMNKVDILSLQRGIKKAARRFCIAIIGGDTIENSKLDLSITIISKTTSPIFRNSLQRGDLLAYTGSLGTSLRDLTVLLNGGRIAANAKFYAPRIRKDFMDEAAEYMSCCMDISDGLFKELERLSSLNKIGFSFMRPISQDVGCSGEEYELLFGFHPSHEANIARIAAKTRTKITIIARAIRGRYRCECPAWHFAD